MGKTALTVSAEAVNKIWDIGSGIYHSVSDEISEAIDREALDRTERYFKNSEVDPESHAFKRRFRTERQIVAKELKSAAFKGGLIVMGINWLI
jgi:Mn-dependent DtxR family transcriptional regulator